MSIRRCALLLFIACTPACNDVTSMDEVPPNVVASRAEGTLGAIQVEQVTLHGNDDDDRHMEVRGVVRNTGEVPLFVEVRTAILDEQCQELGVWRVPVPRVPADGVAPFQSYVVIEGKKHLARLAEAHVTLAAPAD